jgi:type I restriction enzyme, S subunit
MKDSGVPWLGKMPEHWEVKKIRDAAKVVNGYPFDSDRFTTSKGHPLIRIRDLDKTYTTVRYDGPFVDAAHVDTGDVLIGMDGDFNVGTWAGTERALLNQRMCCIRAETSTTSRFLRYVLPQPLKEINDVAAATTVKHLTSGEVKRIAFGWPPGSDQIAIVRFLDHFDERIARYIRAKRKLIKLLVEQKQVIIHEAVTRGLRQDITYKSAGLPWLPEVPENWELIANRSLFRIHKDLVGTRSTEYTLLSLTMRGVIPRDLENAKGKFPASFDTYQIVEPGDLVFCLFDIDETPRTIGIVPTQGMLTSAYTRMRCFDAGLTRFLYYYYRAMDDRKCLKPLYSGLRKVIRKGTFMGCKTPVPPQAEREAIVAFIEKRVAETDAAVGHAEREIALLREYRRRLILDVVAGKLDVRDAAKQLPGDVEVGASSDEVVIPDHLAEEDLDAGFESDPEEVEA